MKASCFPIAVMVLMTLSLFFHSEVVAQSKTALGSLAVSPDNSMLVAAGYNRTMYVCNPEDLSVNKRVYLKVIPRELQFSKDGKSLVLFSSDRFIILYETGTWNKKAEIKKVYDMVALPEADKLIVMHSIQYQNGKRFTPIAVYRLSSGEKLHEQTFEIQGSAIGASPDGKQIVLISSGRQDESEAKEDVPKDLRGLARDEFVQKHDGRVSDIIWMDEQLAETQKNTSFYANSGVHRLLVRDGKAQFIVYNNECIEFTPSGDTKMFETAISYNYGIGASDDQTRLATGGLSDGMLMNMENRTAVSFKHSRLPGFPEYFYGFAFGPDGTVYGGTSAWRIIKISPSGEVLKEQPIY